MTQNQINSVKNLMFPASMLVSLLAGTWWLFTTINNVAVDSLKNDNIIKQECFENVNNINQKVILNSAKIRVLEEIVNGVEQQMQTDHDLLIEIKTEFKDFRVDIKEIKEILKVRDYERQ